MTGLIRSSLKQEEMTIAHIYSLDDWVLFTEVGTLENERFGAGIRGVQF